MDTDALFVLVGRTFATREAAKEEAQKVVAGLCPSCQLICRNAFQFECSGFRQGCKLRITLSAINNSLKIISCSSRVFHPTRETIGNLLESDMTLMESIYFQFHVLLKLRFDPKRMIDVLQVPLNLGLFSVPPPKPMTPANNKTIQKLQKYHTSLYGEKKIDTIEKVFQLSCALQVVRLGFERLPAHNLREFIRLVMVYSSSPIKTKRYTVSLSSVEKRKFKKLEDLLIVLRQRHSHIPGQNQSVQNYTYRVYKTKDSGKLNVQVECSEKPRGCPFKAIVTSQGGVQSLLNSANSEYTHIHSESIEVCARRTILQNQVVQIISTLDEEQINWVFRMLCID